MKIKTAVMGTARHHVSRVGRQCDALWGWHSKNNTESSVKLADRHIQQGAFGVGSGDIRGCWEGTCILHQLNLGRQLWFVTNSHQVDILKILTISSYGEFWCWTRRASERSYCIHFWAEDKVIKRGDMDRLPPAPAKVADQSCLPLQSMNSDTLCYQYRYVTTHS